MEVGADYNIVSGEALIQSNKVFLAQKSQNKRLGKGSVNSTRPCIEHFDMKKLYYTGSSSCAAADGSGGGVSDADNPSGLLRKVFFEIIFFICRRGRENLRALTTDHFAVVEDKTGKFVCQEIDELIKNKGENDSSSKTDGGRMYATGNVNCSVTSFEKYLSHRNPQCTTFFQRPKRHVRSGEDVWYRTLMLPLESTPLAT